MKNTRNFMLRLVLVNLLLCSAFQYIYAQNVVATQNPPVYNGGQVQYDASSSTGSYSIYTAEKTSGQTLVSSNYNGGQITYPTNEPGIYFAKSFGSFGVAAYKPFEIKTTSQEPSDFDTYWSNVVNQLPNPNAQLTNQQTQGNITTADLRLNNIEGKKVYCKIAYPTNGSNMGGILRIQAFSGSNDVQSGLISTFAQQHNVIAIAISGISDVTYGAGGSAVEPKTNREDFYYKTSIAACYQALRYITSRQGYSAQKGIGLFGESQGAGLSLMVGGIDAVNDNLVKCLLVTQPILCDNTAILSNKASGFPDYIHKARVIGLDENAVAAAVPYYDATHAAKRINDPVYLAIGYRDTTTHPAGNLAAFNELRVPVHLAHGVDKDHNHSINGFWSGALSRMFFERYLNGNIVSQSGSTIYFVDAGLDKNTTIGTNISLSGTIDQNNTQTPPNTQVQWSCVTCPAMPNFSNQNDYTTNASFPANGTYTLRFGPVKSTGDAADKLYIPSGDPNLYHTAVDYVVVTVGGVGCTDNDGDGFCQADDCDDNDASVPTTPGTSCNDGNPNTNNDVIQADGCTCQGTITPTGCAIDLVSFTKTTDNNSSCDTYKLTMASSAAQTTAATIQIANLPTNGFSGNTAGVGSLSWVNQTAYNWNIPANSNGLHTATFEYCWAQGTSAQATFNDNTCNDAITVGGVVCTDNDGDGVCADADCDDNDASIPTTPGTGCNDGNPNTNNDVIQADGCTCQGTITPTGCAVDLVSFTRTTGSDPNCDTYNLTIGASAIQNTDVTIQIANLPGNGYTGNTAGVGTLSWAGQTAYNWNIPANSNGLHLATFSYCWAADAAAEATFNDGTCNETIVVNNGNKVILNPDDISLYPNPAKNEVYLALEALIGQQATITISNTMGQTVQVLSLDEITDAPVHIHTDTYASGLYFIHIQTNDNQRISKKLIINKNN